MAPKAARVCIGKGNDQEDKSNIQRWYNQYSYNYNVYFSSSSDI